MAFFITGGKSGLYRNAGTVYAGPEWQARRVGPDTGGAASRFPRHRNAGFAGTHRKGIY